MTIEPISDERLAEIRAGLEGVTPGPWAVEDDLIGCYIEGRYEWSDVATAGSVDRDHRSERQHNAAHIARLDPQTVSALLARLDKAEARLSLASTFWLNGSIAIERRANDSWAIKDGGNVLCADGEWEYEPFPSSRTDEFIARTRFTLDDAFHRAKAALPPPPSSES